MFKISFYFFFISFDWMSITLKYDVMSVCVCDYHFTIASLSHSDFSENFPFCRSELCEMWWKMYELTDVWSLLIEDIQSLHCMFIIKWSGNGNWRNFLSSFLDTNLDALVSGRLILALEAQRSNIRYHLADQIQLFWVSWECGTHSGAWKWSGEWW